jgi:hypothetical protein
MIGIVEVDGGQITLVNEVGSSIGTNNIPIRIDPVGTTSQPVNHPAVTLTGSGNILNQDIIASNVSNYSNIELQITGTFTATVTFQGSNDNTNFVSVNGQTISNGTTAVVQTANASGFFTIPVLFKYFRLRITAYTSGTINVTAFLHVSTVSFGQRTVASTQSGNWNSRTQDGSGNAITSFSAGTTRPLDIAIVNPSGTRIDPNIAKIRDSNNNSIILGQKISNNSVPVVVSSDQSAIEIKATAFPLPTGAATESSLSTIKNRIDSNISTRASQSTLSTVRDRLDIGLSTRASQSTLAVIRDSVSKSTDNTTFTYNISPEQPVGGIYNDSISSVISGRTGAFSVTKYRGIHANLRDSSGNEITSSYVGTKRPLDVLIRDNSGNSVNPSEVKILDSLGINKLKINVDGSINVNTAIPTPPSSIVVISLVQDSVPGSSFSDTRWIIPNNTTFHLQRFKCGGDGSSGDQTRFFLVFNNTGTTFSVNSIYKSVFYFNGFTCNFFEDFSEEIEGNGVKSFIIRRQRANATARILYSVLYGYIVYNTVTVHETGTSPTVTNTTFTKDAGVTWTVNQHANRYVRFNNGTPFFITSNTTTVATIVGNIDPNGSTIPYTINSYT